MDGLMAANGGGATAETGAREGLLSELIRKGIFGGATGVGALLCWALLEAARTSPQGFFAALTSWSPLMLMLPMTGLFGMAIWFGNQRMIEFIGAVRESAGSQKELSEAVRQIAAKDDVESQVQRATLSHMSEQMEKILARLDELRPRGNE